jgi:hypothetical protein
MSNLDAIRIRIAKKGIHAADIRHEGLLTDDEIAYIEILKVYEWVKTGQWKMKDFNKWLKVLRVIE